MVFPLQYEYLIYVALKSIKLMTFRTSSVQVNCIEEN